MQKTRVVILMGVAGVGKTAVGMLFAARNGGSFFDGDDFHPPSNIEKMSAGIPLDDLDRAPWLARLHCDVVDGDFEECQCPVVLACSALKAIYRDALGVGRPGVALVYLTGSKELLEERLGRREDHYMKPEMLDSQLAALEEPTADEALWVDVSGTLDEVVTAVEAGLDLCD